MLIAMAHPSRVLNLDMKAKLFIYIYKLLTKSHSSISKILTKDIDLNNVILYCLQLLVRWLTGYSGTPLLTELKAIGLLDTNISHWQIYQSTNTLTFFSNSSLRHLRQQLSAVPWQRELSSTLTFCTLCF